MPVKVQSKGELKGAGAGGGGEAHLSMPQRRKLHQRERPHSKTEAELQEETHPHPPEEKRTAFSHLQKENADTGVRGRQLHFFLQESEANRTTSPMDSQK